MGDAYDTVEKAIDILATAAANRNDKAVKEVTFKNNVFFTSSV